MTIDLPYGGKDARFDTDELLAHIRAAERASIVLGGRNRVQADHEKPRSLDDGSRTTASRPPDTKQTARAVTDALVAIGPFEHRKGLPCPDTGRRCQGLVLRS